MVEYGGVEYDRDWQLLEFHKEEIEELVAAEIVPDFCYRINNLYTTQFSSLGYYYCANCFQVELANFGCPNQRNRYIDHVNYSDHVEYYVHADLIIDILSEVEDDEFCCKCGEWSVNACGNVEGLLDPAPYIRNLVNQVQRTMGLYRGDTAATP